MKHIVCFHLFNDYSGSPRILKTVLEELLSQGTEIDLLTSKGGILDSLQDKHLKRHCCRYSFSRHPLVTFCRYTAAQLYSFFFSFRYIFDKDTVFYINTLLPAAPALAGRIMRKEVVYHYHENAFIKGRFYKFLAKCMQKLATKIICVSEYQASFLEKKKDIHVIPNAVPDSFIKKLHPDAEKAFGRKRILMAGSLKRYKGTPEFVQLAEKLPEYSFELVLNDSLHNIEEFWKEHHIGRPENLTVYPRQGDVSEFYNRASMVISLTNRELAIETFGLTILEAMWAGLPVIVPTVGGIAEMVVNSCNGYRIDVQHLDKIAATIAIVLSDKTLYQHLASKALETAGHYSQSKMTARITALFQNTDSDIRTGDNF